MTVTATHAPGTFCWIELAAHDNDAARAFYTALLGWSVNETRYGDGPNDVYYIYQLNGADAAASYPMDPGQKEAGMPSAWLLYVAVEDVEASAARAREAGGTLLMEPFDVMAHGRMALVQDPMGAPFALWQPLSHPGVGVRDEPGSLCWSELATPDAGRARDFYTGLFGWGTQPFEGPVPYTMFTLGEQMVGGMYQPTPDMQMPPTWLPYFAVADADAAAEQVRALGGTVLMGPDDIPGVGRSVLAQDPQGAMFYVIKLVYPDQS